jgi:hypothetical protein
MLWKHMTNNARHVSNGIDKDTLHEIFKRLEDVLETYKETLKNHVDKEEAWQLRVEQKLDDLRP